MSERSFLKKPFDYIKPLQKRGKSEFGFEHNAAGRCFVAKLLSDIFGPLLKEFFNEVTEIFL